MQNKRAQISMFIIIGLVLLILAGILIYYVQIQDIQESEIEKIVERPTDIAPIKNYVEACIESVGEDAIVWIGRHGGYHYLPEKSVSNSIVNTAYYFYEFSNLMPSLAEVEKQLSSFLNEDLSFCLKNFQEFRNIGYNITQGEVNASTVISPDGVVFNVNFPLTIITEGKETNIQLFTLKVDNVRLLTMYNVSRQMVNSQMEDFTSICLSCIIDIAVDNDVHIDTKKLDDDSYLFTITDFNSEINQHPYRYRFANKYEEFSCDNIPPDASPDFLLDCVQTNIEDYDYEFIIQEIPDMIAVQDVPFTYEVLSSGFDVEYSDSTSLFDISSEGHIEFTPTANQVGEYSIWIKGVDGLGNEEFETFKIFIVSNYG